MVLSKLQPKQLDHNSPTFFWIAYYQDGTCVSQIDPKDCHEVLWSTVDQSRIQAVAWHPIRPDLAKRLQAAGHDSKPSLFLPSFKVTLGKGDVAVCYREGAFAYGSVLLCVDCGLRWMPSHDPGIPLPFSDKKQEMKDKDGGRYVSYVCPKCGAYTVHVCPKCQVQRTKYVDGFRCNLCQQPLPDRVTPTGFEMRRTIYVLGTTRIEKVREGSTPDGVKILKSVMRIDEHGNVEMRS